MYGMKWYKSLNEFLCTVKHRTLIVGHLTLPLLTSTSNEHLTHVLSCVTGFFMPRTITTMNWVMAPCYMRPNQTFALLLLTVYVPAKPRSRTIFIYRWLAKFFTLVLCLIFAFKGEDFSCPDGSLNIFATIKAGCLSQINEHTNDDMAECKKGKSCISFFALNLNPIAKSHTAQLSKMQDTSPQKVKIKSAANQTPEQANRRGKQWNFGRSNSKRSCA